MVVSGNGSDSNSEIAGSNPAWGTKKIIMTKEEILNITSNPGIYLLHNNINNKCYIGQAINIKKRLLHHLSNLNTMKYDAPIYKSIHKYGIENFSIKILYTTDNKNFTEVKKQLDLLEKKYIIKYNSYGSTGYNQTLGGDAGILGYKFTDVQLLKHSKNTINTSQDGRYMIYIYDIIDNMYYTMVNLKCFNELKHTNIHVGNIRNLLTYKRYILSRNKEDLEKKISIYLNILQTSNYRGGKFLNKIELTENNVNIFNT